MRPINRPIPKTPVGRMITHVISAPLATHWRTATCEEFGCLQYQHGWTLNTTGLSERDIHLARNSGRNFVVRKDESTGDVLLVFSPHQPCFRHKTHKVRVDRPELFLRFNGDWRGRADPPGTKPLLFSSCDSFSDSMHTYIERVTKGLR